MADTTFSSEQTKNTIMGAVVWGLGAGAVVALAPLTLPLAAAIGVGAAATAAVGTLTAATAAVPWAAAAYGAWKGSKKTVQ